MNEEISKKTQSGNKFLFGNCKICNDKATGIHYGVATCEGCKVCTVLNIMLSILLKIEEFVFKKGFYKRSILRRRKYNCYFEGKCIITADKRKRCKACRFKTCLDAGMSMEGK